MATTTLTGTTGNDILNAPGSVSTLVQGLQGNDTITLALANDEAGAGAGNDNITIFQQGILVNTIQGGDGNDTVRIGSAAQFGGYVDLGAGADSIAFTQTNPLINGGQIFGGEGADTIRIGNSLVNSTVGGGSGNDLLGFSQAGTITSTLINGGKEKDTIRFGAANQSFATVAGGQGSDVITLSAGAFANSLVGGGQGADSIALGAGAIASVAGGGLADTIRFNAAFGGGVVYGDANDVTTEGSGTEGAADGGDLIISTQFQFAAITSIYGAGGNDTIAISAGNFASTQNVIDGGAGADSINLANVAGFGNVTGGSGLDTINWSGAATAQTGIDTMATISGGDGADLIVLSGATAGFSANANNQTATGSTIAGGTYQAILSGVSGDKLLLLTASTFGSANTFTSNWSLAGAPTIFVASGNGFNNATQAAGFTNAATAVGSIAVFSDGTDSVIGIYAGGGGNVGNFERILIKGVDLTVTTVVGSAVTLTATTFRFSVAAQTAGGMQITFA